MKIRAIITVAIEVNSDEIIDSEDTIGAVDIMAKRIVEKEVTNVLKGKRIYMERRPTVKLVKVTK